MSNHAGVRRLAGPRAAPTTTAGSRSGTATPMWFGHDVEHACRGRARRAAHRRGQRRRPAAAGVDPVVGDHVVAVHRARRGLQQRGAGRRASTPSVGEVGHRRPRRRRRREAVGDLQPVGRRSDAVPTQRAAPQRPSESSGPRREIEPRRVLTRRGSSSATIGAGGVDPTSQRRRTPGGGQGELERLVAGVEQQQERVVDHGSPRASARGSPSPLRKTPSDLAKPASQSSSLISLAGRGEPDDVVDAARRAGARRAAEEPAAPEDRVVVAQLGDLAR